MKISTKLNMDKNGLMQHGPVNIVILGDSVSHGAVIDNIDYETVYWNRLRKMLNAYREYVPVNMICAAIGGTTAKDALSRLDAQVLRHRPDLVIVSFGLNDVNHPLEDYLRALTEIFDRCLAVGCDVIFMTPNMLNTYVAEDTAKHHLDYAAITAEYQNNGTMDRYIYSAAQIAKKLRIPVCDCYSKWKALSNEQDTTMLLANRINHPIPQMHELFAQSLYDMIIGTHNNVTENDSTMYAQAKKEDA